MSENSKIEWCDHTFNPWIGCTQISPGCKHCYAESMMDKRLGVASWSPGAERVRTKPANWKMPLRWNAQADAFMAQHGRRQRVFCASLADWLDNQVDTEWLADLLEVVRNTPNLDWLLLSKRIGTWRARIKAAFEWVWVNARVRLAELLSWLADWLDGKPPANVWIGATIVNQPEADRDIIKLLQVRARVRFLSMEPLLGSVLLTSSGRIPADDEGPERIGYMVGPDDGKSGLWPTPEQALQSAGIHWVIVGGESGHNARPMHPEWARSLRDQCQAAGVPFLFKQWGEFNFSPITLSEDRPHICAIDQTGEDWAVSVNDGKVSHLGPRAAVWTLDEAALPRPGLVEQHCVGKKAAGRLLDGRTWDEFPS